MSTLTYTTSKWTYTTAFDERHGDQHEQDHHDYDPSGFVPWRADAEHICRNMGLPIRDERYTVIVRFYRDGEVHSTWRVTVEFEPIAKATQMEVAQ